MSHKLRDLILAMKGLPGGQKHVLAAMAHWAKDDGTSIFPKVLMIADRAGMSERQTQRNIRAMEESRILRVKSRSSGKRGQANHWEIDLEVLTGARVSICHPSNRSDGDAAGHGCQNVTRDAGTGDSSGADGCHFGPDGVTLLTPLIDNDQENHQGIDQATRAREPVQRNLNLMLPITGDKPAYPAGFELVWSELTRCPGFTALMGKHEAFLAYEALGNRPADGDLCRAARGYGRHLAAENARRPPSSPHPMLSPVNWFGRRRYAQFLDDPEQRMVQENDPPTLDQASRARLLAAGLAAPLVDAWFGHAEFAVVGDELHVKVPKAFTRNWIANHFPSQLEKAWADQGRLSVKVLCKSEERAA